MRGMAESLQDPSAGAEPGPESPEALLREGAREAERALGALEEVVVRDRQAIAALQGELARCVRDLQYERRWRGKDQLLNLAHLLSTRAKEAEGELGTLLEQVAACQRLKGKHTELMEALSLLETELAAYAQALTAPDAAFDSTTSYGAYVPALRLFAAEMEAVLKEFSACPAPDDFVEGTMHRKYQAALERLAPLARSLSSPPPYMAAYERLSAARERLMRGIVLVKMRADRDAAILKNVEQVKADLASEFERVEALFAELEAVKSGSLRFPPAPPMEPAARSGPSGPAPEEPRRRGILGRLRK